MPLVLNINVKKIWLVNVAHVIYKAAYIHDFDNLCVTILEKIKESEKHILC